MQRRAVNNSKRMLRPTDDLRDDHVLIASGLCVLVAISRWVEDGEDFPAQDCATVLRFLREWAVAVHMEKEDGILGPAIAMRADEDTAAVVGEVMRLHEEIAELAHALVLFWEPVGELTETERQGFGETVRALVTRIERRRQLEEGDLFPACNEHVPADDQLDWLDQFHQLESDRSSRAFWATCIGQLAKRWLN